MKLFFLEKHDNSSHPPVPFNNNDINKYPHHKHLGIVLDSKLDFEFHVDQKIKICNNRSYKKALDHCAKEGLSHYIQIVYLTPS